MINETPPGQLAKYLLGDLGVALRHCQRVREGSLEPTHAVFHEVQRSIEDCVARIKRDLAPPPEGT